jgi:nitroreductase
MPSTIENLQWRYATKQYDASKKLSEEQRNLIMEALRLAPSSFGLQPWKFIHVTDTTLREKLKAAAWGQPQLTDASDIFVLCSLAKLDEAYINRFVADTAKTRSVTVESLADYKKYMMGSVQPRTEQQIQDWNARQVYIALGIALAAAAENQIDASPMEGFDAKQFDEILGLGALGVQSRAILAVGFRSPNDASQKLQKVRFAKEDVIIER